MCRFWGVRALVAVALTAGAPAAQGARAYAVDADNLFLRFDTNQGSLSTPGAISGLDTGESVAGIDVRPATGQIYLLARNFSGGGKLYTVNSTSGQLTYVALLSRDLTGILQGIDFDPVTDRLRVISSDGQNLRVNPVTGEATLETPIAYAPGDPNAGKVPTVLAAAYSNNFVGAGATSLYVLDNETDALVRVEPSGGGVLHTVGALGVDLGGPVAFDIAPSPVNHAYATIPVGVRRTALFLIDLQTGHASHVRDLGSSLEIRAFTIAWEYPQTGFSRNQGIRINSAGTGHQVLNYNYTTGQLAVSPYSNVTGEVPRFFPYLEWTGAFLYDFASGRFSQAAYSSQDPL